MLKLLPLLLLGGCVASQPPSSRQTEFKEDSRDWAQVYRMEIKIAVENEDLDAYNFFFEEYMRMRVEQINENPK